jgi:hypothetical protein
MLNRLREGQDNTYYITNTKSYKKISAISEEDVNECFNFSYGMTFGAEGEHRNHRSGGSHRRKNGELFINTFQGKLAEFSFYRFLEKKEISSERPDTAQYSLGIWDSYDLAVKGNIINIKSTKHYGNLLLLETKDWNSEADYIPNLNTDNTYHYDFFVFLRLSPDGESLMKSKRFLYCDSLSETELKKMILSTQWDYDIPGYITRELLKEAIIKKYILPKNSMLNGKTKMDAENYYIQAGDMLNIEKLIEHLNK